MENHGTSTGNVKVLPCFSPHIGFNSVSTDNFPIFGETWGNWKGLVMGWRWRTGDSVVVSSSEVLNSFLAEYNTMAKRGMELVLFMAAAQHVSQMAGGTQGHLERSKHLQASNGMCFLFANAFIRIATRSGSWRHHWEMHCWPPCRVLEKIAQAPCWKPYVPWSNQGLFSQQKGLVISPQLGGTYISFLREPISIERERDIYI